ncbi:MAG: glycosyl transferase [Hyphomicrobiaceae bacterium]|nr:glycosyl transferase [Hyphomicrobiaceae bacterium]
MLWLAAFAAALVWALVGAYVAAMRRYGRLDAPNARSMHARPKPAGAGIVAVPVAVLGWLWLIGTVPQTAAWVAAGALGLSALGWADDMRGLPVRLRLLAQILAVVAVVAVLPAEARVWPALPLAVERGLEILAWVWFVNLFNFMDGIDGLAGSEAAMLGAGYVLVAGVAAIGAPLGVLIAGAMVGYLVWNWAPGRVMMGDAGSLPLGYLTGWLMLDLALAGHLAAALILPAYFVADATSTLVSRLARGKLPYEAHREHFYQLAALGCGSHGTVVTGVIAANVALVLLALVSLRDAVAAGMAALLVLAVLFAWLAWLQQAKARQA